MSRSTVAFLVLLSLLTILGVGKLIHQESPGAAVQASKAIVDPELAGLPVEQKLDRALSVKGVQGVVRGTTRQPAVRLVPDGSSSMTATDFPFTVVGFYGRGDPPYAPGRTITLRVPGGTIGNLVAIAEYAPTVTAGQDLFVFVRDQGKNAGGNTANVLVAADGVDVLELRDGAVYGQGPWAGFSEPVDRFLLHFTH